MDTEKDGETKKTPAKDERASESEAKKPEPAKDAPTFRFDDWAAL